MLVLFISSSASTVKPTWLDSFWRYFSATVVEPDEFEFADVNAAEVARRREALHQGILGEFEDGGFLRQEVLMRRGAAPGVCKPEIEDRDEIVDRLSEHGKSKRV